MTGPDRDHRCPYGCPRYDGCAEARGEIQRPASRGLTQHIMRARLASNAEVTACQTACRLARRRWW